MKGVQKKEQIYLGGSGEAGLEFRRIEFEVPCESKWRLPSAGGALVLELRRLV